MTPTLTNILNHALYPLEPYVGLCGGIFLKPKAKNKFHRRKPTYIYYSHTSHPAGRRAGPGPARVGRAARPAPSRHRPSVRYARSPARPPRRPPARPTTFPPARMFLPRASGRWKRPSATVIHTSHPAVWTTRAGPGPARVGQVTRPARSSSVELGPRQLAGRALARRRSSSPP